MSTLLLKRFLFKNLYNKRNLVINPILMIKVTKGNKKTKDEVTKDRTKIIKKTTKKKFQNRKMLSSYTQTGLFISTRELFLDIRRQ